MPVRRPLDLATFDDQLLDGLDFCSKVYHLFDDVRNGSDGIARLRLRPTILEKRLVEELIPLAQYVQMRYRADRRIKVRWFNGSRSYDAQLWSSGSRVEQGQVPRKLLVEITTSVHHNEHLARQLLHRKGGSFGVKGITVDKSTGEIVSRPHVRMNNEAGTDLADQIIDRLKRKSEKTYPPGTVLVVNCVPNTAILDADWDYAIRRVIEANVHLGFQEVFLFESLMSHSMTLYGQRRRDVGAKL